MKTLSICTTLEAACNVVAALPENEGPHALVLVQEAVACTRQDLDTRRVDVWVSAEDAKARGCEGPWANVDAPGLVRMIVDCRRVHVL